MKCDTMECFSEAVAESTDNESAQPRHYCIECAIAIVKQWGPGCLRTMDSYHSPWEADKLGTCEYCGTDYSKYLIGLTGDCPKCRKPLPKEKLDEARRVHNL